MDCGGHGEIDGKECGICHGVGFDGSIALYDEPDAYERDRQREEIRTLFRDR